MNLLFSSHNLDFSSFPMKIVKFKLSAASSDIMNTTSQALRDTFEFGSSWYLPI